MKHLLPIILYSLSFGLLSAQQAVTIKSLRSLASVGSPVLSPDGSKLIYSITRTDIEANQRNSTLMLMDMNTRESIEFTKGIWDVSWSPDGKYISYKKGHEGKTGLFISEFIKGRQLGKPKFLAFIHNSNHFLGHMTRKNYEWSPDGNHIGYVSADLATCQEEKDPNEPRVITRTMYKSRTGFSDNCLTRIYLVDVRTGKIKLLTSGPFDSHSISWAPDSRSLAFVSNKSEDPDHNYNNDVWTVNINDLSIDRLTNSPGTEHNPRWSPAGSWIAYPATKRRTNTKDSPAEDTRIYMLATDGSKEINLTRALDLGATNPRWHPRGEWLYFSAQEKGKNVIYRVRSGSDPEAVVNERGYAGSLSVGMDQVVYTLNKPGHPTEIYRADPDGKNQEQLTFHTSDWVSQHTLSKTEDFWYASFDGTMVQGFITYPENIPEGRKLPVIHTIHGGPHEGVFYMNFSAYREILVGAGYAVVFINPRGSSGYGQKFTDGTYQAWGGGDYKDLMIGMDVALDSYSFLDETRMGVTGGSYGGFMTNWVISHTDRYQGAVTMGSLSNLISFYGTSVYQLLIENEFNGMPWDNYDLLWHFSPLAHVENVKTPTLFLHGEDDMDVPVSQAEEFYIALKKLGIPSRFVRYPNIGHEIGWGWDQPRHREHYYNEILDWFEKYVRQ